MAENKTKTLLIAAFTPKNNMEWYFKYLFEKFKIKKNEIYIYEIDNNEIDYLITFKLKIKKNIDLKFHFPNATIVNIKEGCIFSINGLNRLIEEQVGCEQGNADYKNYKIDWLKHKNTLILSNKNKLIVKTIKKINIFIEKKI